MGENIAKWSNWQEIHLQNIQTAHVFQYQKKKKTIQSKSWQKIYKNISAKKTYRWPTKKKFVMHYLLTLPEIGLID